jgi:predicted ABC-type ATPase
LPTLLIIAGPNGAGKTTFAGRYLLHQRRDWPFVNADEIARTCTGSGFSQLEQDVLAGRAMLERINALTMARADFVIETTLATRGYARKIISWKQTGYTVSLFYLRLSSIESSLVRVARRVQTGGHGIPEDTIRRRFARSLDYLENIYKPIVDEWYVWDSLEGDFALAEAWDDNNEPKA